MRLMILGDTHGNTPFAEKVVRHAKRHGADKIVQVGDFGLWDHWPDGVKFLDTLNDALRREGVKLYAVGGNHENWIRWNWYIENNPKTAEGFTMIRSHIMIMPKTFRWQWDGKRFAAAGGAVSIDKQYRLQKQKETGPDTLFWYDEQLLDSDVESIPERKVDYLFTHDCSNSTPFRERIKPDFDSQIHRQRIDRVLEKTAPEMHFHGHMHTKYDWMNMHNSIVGVHWTQTYGLECDGMYWSWGILDTDLEKFVFAPSVSHTWSDAIVPA